MVLHVISGANGNSGHAIMEKHNLLVFPFQHIMHVGVIPSYCLWTFNETINQVFSEKAAHNLRLKSKKPATLFLRHCRLPVNGKNVQKELLDCGWFQLTQKQKHTEDPKTLNTNEPIMLQPEKQFRRRISKPMSTIGNNSV